MDICFEGVGQAVATFQVDGEGVRPGMAVTLTNSGTVGLGSDGAAGRRAGRRSRRSDRRRGEGGLHRERARDRVAGAGL